jgi:hypothetical protein
VEACSDDARGRACEGACDDRERQVSRRVEAHGGGGGGGSGDKALVASEAALEGVEVLTAACSYCRMMTTWYAHACCTMIIVCSREAAAMTCMMVTTESKSRGDDDGTHRHGCA